jgi:hypothetical protein
MSGDFLSQEEVDQMLRPVPTAIAHHGPTQAEVNEAEERARTAAADSFLKLETELNADPKFNELVKMTLERALDAAGRMNVPPILVVQCLFNRAAKATRDVKLG